jgi:hypothetical protein
MRSFVRLLLFAVFFSVGTASLATSVLCEDLLRYYNYKQLLTQAEQNLDKLKSLNKEYDTLLNNIQNDPNLLDRAAMAVLGQRPAEPNAVYPKASPEQLAAVKQALAEINESRLSKPAEPKWLKRIAEPSKRLTLFISGAALVLISFVCFGPAKTIRTEED